MWAIEGTSTENEQGIFLEGIKKIILTGTSKGYTRMSLFNVQDLKYAGSSAFYG